MTNICLIRHGETEWNTMKLIQGRIDTLLCDSGIKQAEIAGEKLLKLNIKWDCVYSSPLQRAIKTAQVALNIAKIDKEIILSDDLIERDFGPFEGMEVTDENFYKLNHLKNNGAEPLDVLISRVYQGLNKIIEKHRDSNILIFTHSQVIKAILIKLIDEFDFNASIRNASLNFIEVDSNNKYYVRKTNY